MIMSVQQAELGLSLRLEQRKLATHVLQIVDATLRAKNLLLQDKSRVHATHSVDIDGRMARRSSRQARHCAAFLLHGFASDREFCLR